jgi:hypothetical protein
MFKNNIEHVTLVRKSLSENLILPKDINGKVIEPITVNVSARLLMLAVDPESHTALNDKYSAPAKEA